VSAVRPLSAIAFSVALITATAAAAFGDTGSGSGGLGGGSNDPSITVGLRVYAPGAGTTSFAPHDAAAPRPVRYEAIPNHSPPPGLDNLCNAGAPPAIVWGWRYTVNTIDNATGQVLATEQVCVAFPTADRSAPPPPPPLPLPPTIGEIWDAIGIPAPGLGVDPAAEGVVGLETRLWSGGGTDVAVGVAINGFTVTGTAHLTEYRFDPGDGTITSDTTAGSHDAPAARHVYDRKARYTLGVASVWQATVTMTGPGFAAPVPIAIGSAVISATRVYRVVEVRSVLTG
jgi:hypothetical protein